MTSPSSHEPRGPEPLSLTEEQRRAEEADRLRRARQNRPGFPLSYIFRN